MGGRMICKKKWKKPQLIVLVREKSEESVLQVCKIFSEAGPFAGHCLDIYNVNCYHLGLTS